MMIATRAAQPLHRRLTIHQHGSATDPTGTLTLTGTQLVGRDHEVDLLKDLVGEAARGRTVAVTVSGQAGIGKTAVVDELVRLCARQRFLQLRASGMRAERGYPYGVLVELMDAAICAASDEDTLASTDLEDLTRVLPALGAVTPTTATDRPPGPLMVCRAVNKVLGGLAKQHRGVAIIVDDLHWADEASVAVLGYLIRHPLHSPTVIAAAYRSGWDSSALAVGRAEIDGVSAHVDLGPLTPKDASLLLTGVSQELRGAIVDEAGGNPFFLTELARASGSAGAAGQESLLPNRASPATSWEIPDAITAMIGDLLDQCAPAARELALAGAVLGDAFTPTLAGEVADLDQAQVSEGFDDLLRHGLICSHPSRRGAFSFRHALVESVIYASQPTGSRIRRHNAAREALISVNANPVAIARHYEATAAVGDEQAIDYLSKTAASCMSWAPREAARMSDTALALLPQAGPVVRRRPGIVQTRARSLILCGSYELALQELIAQATRAGVNDERDEIFSTLVWATSWLRYLGVPTGEVAGRLSSAATDWAAAQRTQNRLTPASAMILTVLEAERGNFESARQYADDCVDLASRAGSPEVAFTVLSMSARLEITTGEIGPARVRMKEAERLYARLPSSHRHAVVEGMLVLAGARILTDDFADGLALCQQGVSVARSAGNTVAEWLFGFGTGVALAALGELHTAAGALEDAADGLQLLGTPPILALISVHRAYIEALQGKRKSPGVRMAWARNIADFATDPLNRAGFALAEAETHLLLGQFDQVGAAIQDASDGPELDGIVPAYRAAAAGVLSLAAGESGDLGQAARWAGLSRAAAEHSGLARDRWWSGLALSRQAMAIGDLEVAVAAAIEAEDAATEWGHLVNLGVAKLQIAQALAGVDKVDEAATVLSEAQAIFVQTGATLLVAKAQAARRSLGLPRQASPANWERSDPRSLTTREREIAGLAAAGMTSPEIARKLVLSRRTVESHLHRVFAKLNVSRRAELAAALKEFGSTQPMVFGGF
jgi:ATP/maltotriose-dependent transcriptional regulator MalT